jgi:predicted nucleic acid-binding protein
MVIDKYLAKKHANKQNLQLIGIAALYLSAKYE